MKKVSMITVTALLISSLALPSGTRNYTTDSVKAVSDATYTIQDIVNLQNFLLCNETSDLTGKDYDINGDNRWDVFDFCLMKQKYLQHNNQNTEKTLIAYFSLGRNSGNFETADATTSASIVIDNNTRYGTTEYIANLIQQQVGGDLYSIETVEPYSQDFDEVINQNHSEMADDYLPELIGETLDISQYDTVYIGYPIWATTIPRAIYSFLNQYDLSGKTVIPFCTHNGYGKGNSETVVSNLCPQSDVLMGIAIDSRNTLTSQENVEEWLDQLGMIESKETTIQISVGSHNLDGIIYDTPLAKEIMEMMPLTVSMVGYGGVNIMAVCRIHHRIQAKDNLILKTAI